MRKAFLGISSMPPKVITEEKMLKPQDAVSQCRSNSPVLHDIGAFSVRAEDQGIIYRVSQFQSDIEPGWIPPEAFGKTILGLWVAAKFDSALLMATAITEVLTAFPTKKQIAAFLRSSEYKSLCDQLNAVFNCMATFIRPKIVIDRYKSILLEIGSGKISVPEMQREISDWEASDLWPNLDQNTRDQWLNMLAEKVAKKERIMSKEEIRVIMSLPSFQEAQIWACSRVQQYATIEMTQWCSEFSDWILACCLENYIHENYSSDSWLFALDLNLQMKELSGDT